MGISFLAQNPGKKSVTINLKHAEGKALLKRLVEGADVLVENFRPGVMDRLELGWEVLREVNLGLVYCAISGFGQDGPWRDRPAYDQIVQGTSGVMSITGDASSAPLRVGYPVADTIGGLTAAFAIAAALKGRKGCFIDVSMLESVLSTMGWVVSNWLIGGVEPKAFGNENITASPSGTYRCADAPLNIAANEQRQWEALARHVGRADLLDDPAYADRDARIANRAALKAELEPAFATRPARDLARELNELGVPSGAVFTVPEILAHPQVADRGMVATFPEVPGVGQGVRIVRTGIKLDGEAPGVETPPPLLGQHNAEVFGALGLDGDEIARLRGEGAI